MNRKQKFLLLALLAFLLLRLAAVCYIHGQVPLEKDFDATQYNNYALTILKGPAWLRSADFLGSVREPVYPVFLALIYFIFGKENFMAVYIIQALINTFTVFIIYKFTFKLFGKKAAYWALFWSGFYVYYIWYAGLLYREILLYCLVVSLFYLLHKRLSNCETGKRNSRYVKEGRGSEYSKFRGGGSIFVISLLYFTLIYTDSRYLYLLCPILIIMVIYTSIRKGIRDFCIFLCIVILLSIPWVVRNYATYDDFLLISTCHFKPGINIIEGFRHRGAGIQLPDQIRPSGDPEFPREKERRLVKKGLNPNNRSPQELYAIKKDVYPICAYWEKRWFFLKMMWRPFLLHGIYDVGPGFRIRTLRHNIASTVCFGLLLPFALVAAIRLIITKNRAACLLLLLPIFLHTLIHVFARGEIKYRIPTDSFLIMLGSYGIALSCTYLKRLSAAMRRARPGG